MVTIAEQRETLQHRREELERMRASVAERVEAARRELGRGQAELAGLRAQQEAVDADVSATTKLEGDLDAALKTAREIRAGGEAELTAVRQEHSALSDRIEQELSGERRAALSRAVDDVDEAIAAADRAAEDVARRLHEAEEAAADAGRRATEAAAAHEAALAKLHAVPQVIEAARARVVTARTAAATAVDAGRMAEAFLRVRGLGKALESLEQAVQATDDQRVAEELPELWSGALARSGEAATARAAVEPLRAESAAAQGKRDALASARETSIQEILSEPPGPQLGEPEQQAEPVHEEPEHR
jgi:chromosome segregation ATPase